MVLTGRDKKFELEVLGYEFSSSEFIEDLNWLSIKTDTLYDDLNWQTKGSYLRTNELIEIYNWFIGIENESKVKNRINFLEHELSFGYDQLGRIITVNLDFDLHPKGSKYDYDKDEEFKITFNIDDIDLKNIIQSLKSYTEIYPVRLRNIEA